ncbi:MAG: aminomethyl-transferring glycine dehydrogenase subunit GcvPB [Rickettsiales bacterium]|jgi:glycine dehydrogenase subunit 2|nr:aminomethyl-transferring glycine dehydrogenase subunit GcvPB [Rickettsiales bacterium]
MPAQLKENIMSNILKVKHNKTGLDFDTPLLFETSDDAHSKSGVDLEEIPDFTINTGLEEREIINLPSHSEPEVIRHFTRLSQKNFSIDTGFYPLGSCTMKHNPRINEKVARFDGFAQIHPLQPTHTVQGALELMHNLEHWLKELSGLDAVSLLPAAGAHGEYTGMRVIKQSHIKKEGSPRKYVIIPDSAHGTNPSTTAGIGYDILTVKTGPDGSCILSDIEEAVAKYGTEIAAIMITNPNTCGKFEKSIGEISKLIHSVGAYFYCDGANFNAIVGNIRPADFGVDVMHFNLHKTFSTPHGGGGPGCGPIAVCEELSEFLPTPLIIKNDHGFEFVRDSENSIGQIKGFYGQFTLIVRAYAYMTSFGKDGLKQVSLDAVLSANYILSKLKDHYYVPYEGRCMHECLITDKLQKAKGGVTTLDIAKTLIDYGFHPMTTYFPIIVPGTMLIEPTETETKATIDHFIEAMIEIAEDIQDGNLSDILNAPIMTKYDRPDETLAARKPILTYNDLILEDS